MKYQDTDYIFDGFAHRRFDPDHDGWMNELPDEKFYPQVQAARDVISMFNELSAARRKIWELEKELALWKRA